MAARRTPAPTTRASPKPQTPRWDRIQELLDYGGEISLGSTPGGNVFAITASDESQCLAMLRRRPDEGLADMLNRLDQAIGSAWEDETFIDEINV